VSRGAGTRGLVAGAALAAALVLLPGLGARDLWAPDEPRYGRIAEELRRLERGAGDLVLLRLHGVPYTQKPPLYYWLAAGSGAPLGRVTEVAARLPSALAGIALVAITAWAGARLFGRAGAGAWAAAVLLSTWRFAELAGRAQLDVLLAACEATALLALWRVDRGELSARRGLVIAHLALAAALLTKGPVGLLPLAVWAVFLAADGRAREWRRAVPAWGLALSIGPILAWIASATWLAPPGFFDEAVVHNVLARFLTGTAHVRPFYYYAVQLPLEALPWTLVWPFAGAWLIRSLRRPARADGARLLVAWIATFVVFFSLSAGKRGLYLLPAFPALALVVGGWLDARLARGGAPRWLPRALALAGAAAALAGAALALVVGGWLDARLARGGAPRWLPRALALAGAAAALAGAARALRGGLELDLAPGFRLSAPAAAGMASVCAAGVAAGAVLARRGVQGGLAAVPATLAILQLLVFTTVLPGFDPEKSPRPLARAAVRAAGPEGPIGVFDHEAATGGIAYYADRPVAAVPDPAAAERFLARPGAVLLVRRDRWPRLARALPGAIERVAARRSGRRRTWVVRAAPGASPAATPGARREPVRDRSTSP